MDVELQQIIGKPFGNPHGPNIPTDVFFVRVKGVTLGLEGEDADKWCAVGHIHRKAGSVIKFIKRLADEDYQRIRDKVAELREELVSQEMGILGPPDLADRSPYEEEDDDE